MHLWVPGDEISTNVDRLLIGVATYSTADLKLLDAVNRWLAGRTDIRVDTFDVLDIVHPSDFEKYIPGIGRVYQTPVAGLWAGGVLAEAGSGIAARRMLERMGIIE